MYGALGYLSAYPGLNSATIEARCPNVINVCVVYSCYAYDKISSHSVYIRRLSLCIYSVFIRRLYYTSCVMNLCSEFVLLHGTILGVTFGTQRGGETITPTIIPFSVSVLAVVANEVEAPISLSLSLYLSIYLSIYLYIYIIYIYIYIYVCIVYSI